MLVALAIHIVVNDFIKVMPPDVMSAAELRDYLIEQDGNWALVHGLRYVAFVGMALFAGAMFHRTCVGRKPSAMGWGIVGVVGSALHIANILITNGIETFVFHHDSQMPPEQFRLVFNMTRVLFTAELAVWGISLLGYSTAGWVSRRLPRPISILGWLSACCCVLSSVFVVSVWRDGWGGWFTTIGAMTGLLWFVIVGVYLVVKGDH